MKQRLLLHPPNLKEPSLSIPSSSQVISLQGFLRGLYRCNLQFYQRQAGTRRLKVQSPFFLFPFSCRNMVNGLGGEKMLGRWATISPTMLHNYTRRIPLL
ncbi:hypothetical protein CDAR_448101 [Caerostris darwini]|uniref:Uncharacterized protein n=1 Tax=Caerostris darwini TaxID=1538125 RepID=A0AAV4W609_9ARAC|nr:hypothetical protein CDAR_448101 [Caerostris darwini]